MSALAQSHLASGEDGEWSGTGQAPADDRSARGLVQHHVRTPAGVVSLSWEPEEGAFVAERDAQTWSDARLGALARAVGINIPAKVARELRRDERLHPAPRVQTTSMNTPPPAAEAPAEVRIHEADVRRELIENLGAVMQDLAGGELVDEAVRRLQGLADRFSRKVEVERSPTLGARARVHRRMTPPAPTPVDRLQALRSRPAPTAEAIARS